MRVERFQVGPLDNNLYLLTSRATRDVVVIDPSLESGHVLEEIARRQLSVRRILLTHAHIDHIVMVKAFQDATGAPVWLHEGDRPLYERASEQAAMFGFVWPGTAPIAHWIRDADEVGIPGFEIHAFHTPGHSPGSVTFATPGGLISGDVLFRDSVGRVDLPGGDWNTLERSIRERLFVYPRETKVFPGHGPPTTIGHEMAFNPFVGAHALRQA